MPKKAKADVAPVEEVDAAVEAADTTEEVVAAPSSKKSVTVAYQAGEREFSEEVHGKEYKALAAEFAETHNGEIVK